MPWRAKGQKGMRGLIRWVKEGESRVNPFFVRKYGLNLYSKKKMIESSYLLSYTVRNAQVAAGLL